MGVPVVVVGDVAPGLAGPGFAELPQPARVAAAITARITHASLCSTIAHLRSTLWFAGDYAAETA